MSLVVVWLNIVFASFGPYERRNATVVRAISRRVARYRREQHRELWPAYNPDLHLNKNQLRDFCNRHRRLRLLTGQCALIFGEALEFVIDVKEPLQESAKFTLGLRLQLRLE